jgi:ribonuclease P protein component
MGNEFYETTISTVENAPQTAARIFESQLEQERQGDLAKPPARGAQAVDAGVTGQAMAGETPPRLGFGRRMRIKQGRDFSRVRQSGERLVLGCLIANWRRLTPGSASRLGVITSGRIGNAVARNRARRLMRESFRLHQHELAQPVELVLVARPSLVGKGFFEVEKDFLTTLRKAGLLR